MKGFSRVSGAVTECVVADTRANAERTIALLRTSDAQGDAVVVFPELGLTGYTARDLFADGHLLAEAEAALGRVVDASETLRPLALVGMPMRHGPGVYNVAVAIQAGRVLGVVPKSYLPTYREFEEARWFRPGTEVAPGSTTRLLGQDVPFGTDLLFDAGALVVGVEICEDLWVQVPPHATLVGAGANVICNLSASNFTVGKARLRRTLATSASDRGKCAYVYVAAGPGESSTDLAFDADAFICENGRVLVESKRFDRGAQLVTADLDLEFLAHDRRVTGTFGDCAAQHQIAVRTVGFDAPARVEAPLRRVVPRHPFVPHDPATLGDRCWEIFEIQTHALATRMEAIGEPTLVLGLSGGLDSTQAALVCAGALDLLGRPRSALRCVTMPGFGTTAGTRGNAERLAEALGAQLQALSISEVSHAVLRLVGHEAADEAPTLEAMLERLRQHPELGDVSLENVQARMRTLVLMTQANRHRGIVVGTGDLSEKALGWSTYAGDQIAMYDVNAGIPKTLIQSVIRWVANEKVATWSVADAAGLRQTLFDILDTPISPELLPADANGQIAQLTESSIGPYELHDFYLYAVVRHGARPSRILDLAQVAFGDDYDLDTHKRWLRVFIGRFFRFQFKRSCTPDGPKVGQVALSPRGDWRMPSDARARTWLEEIDAYEG
ncbi:MAG: NAD(+) synthase [Nannocystaceae bacterium]|nr:NAD(+) synthase [bacterium]